ncbi:MAG: Gfo/Idh/MocA family protein [Aureliella sp.]
MKLRLGLIGQSTDWQQRHLPALRMLGDRFEVRAVYNAVSSLAEKAATEFDARAYCGFREMIADPEVDAILFLESAWYGTAPVQAACEFGKAIYCGTEVHIPTSQANALRRIVDQSGIAFMAEFPRRLAPATLRLKELIATQLGQPRLLFCHGRVSPSAGIQDSEAERIIRRELVELLDWSTFIAAKPMDHIQGTEHRNTHDQSNVDYMSMSVGFRGEEEQSDAALAQISCGGYIPSTWEEASNFRPPADIQVRCEHGLAFLDLPNTLIWFDEAGRHQESLEAELPVGAQLLTQFHRAVTSLVRKMADLHDVCRGLTALEVAQDSIRRGCRLELKYDSNG